MHVPALLTLPWQRTATWCSPTMEIRFGARALLAKETPPPSHSTWCVHGLG